MDTSFIAPIATESVDTETLVVEPATAGPATVTAETLVVETAIATAELDVTETSPSFNALRNVLGNLYPNHDIVKTGNTSNDEMILIIVNVPGETHAVCAKLFIAPSRIIIIKRIVPHDLIEESPRVLPGRCCALNQTRENQCEHFASPKYYVGDRGICHQHCKYYMQWFCNKVNMDWGMGNPRPRDDVPPPRAADFFQFAIAALTSSNALRSTYEKTPEYIALLRAIRAKGCTLYPHLDRLAN